MKNYVKPFMVGQVFTANEYVAACWYVKCDWESSNAVKKIMPPTNPNNNGRNNYTDGQSHAADHCGTSGNQVITTNPSNIATGMYEINSITGVKELKCDLYTYVNYQTPLDYSRVGVGDKIYWTTKLNNGTTWYHQGLVNGVNTAHPNRS